MHDQAFAFVAGAMLSLCPQSVLEIGSLNVNGGIRKLLAQAGVDDYIGIDRSPGRGVDVVIEANAYSGPQVDVVVSMEALEHSASPEDVIYCARRHSRMFVLTAAHASRPPHRCDGSVLLERDIGVVEPYNKIQGPWLERLLLKHFLTASVLRVGEDLYAIARTI